jgi:antitoxin component of MazEF toxin-antitoxin module
MVDTHSSRIFRSGDATTLYVTIPAGVVSDSQFPFDADQEVTVTIDGEQLLVSKDGGETNT